MTRTLPALLAALLFSGAGAAYAQQTPPADAGKGPGKPRAMRDCSKAADPKACEERRTKLRSAREDARKACQGKAGPEHRECMTKATCAKAPDPSKCEAQAKARADARAEKMRRKIQREQGDPNAPRATPAPDAKKP